MAIITMIKVIKEIHPESLVLVKVGKFYNAYGKDSYILSYLFGYKLKTVCNGDGENCTYKKGLNFKKLGSFFV